LEQATCAAGVGDKVEFDARLLEVLGRTAAASAMMFMPSTEAVTENPGSAIIIVSVRLLDSEFLKGTPGETLSMARVSRNWMQWRPVRG
jgi:hypothetical protein